MRDNEDFMLTGAQRQRKRRRRRRIQILLVALLILGVIGFFVARPIRNAIRSWQARRHAVVAGQAHDLFDLSINKNGATRATKRPPLIVYSQANPRRSVPSAVFFPALDKAKRSSFGKGCARSLRLLPKICEMKRAWPCA